MRQSFDQPWHGAIRSGLVSEVRRLIDGGAQVNALLPGELSSPLHLALDDGFDEAFELLIKRGADVNAGRGYSPLMVAAKRGREDFVAVLISMGAIVNTVDPVNGCTALWYAAKEGKKRVVQQLLSSGADSNHRVFGERICDAFPEAFSKSGGNS